MNGQQAYNTIREYFKRDGAELSKVDGKDLPKDGTMPGCFYRHPKDGRACAVGVLLTDSEVMSLFEDQKAERAKMEMSVPRVLMHGVHEIARLPSFPERLKDLDEVFLTKIQNAHDQSYDAQGFIVALDRIAHEYGLKTPY